MKTLLKNLPIVTMTVSTLALAAIVFSPEKRSQDGFWAFFFYDDLPLPLRVALLLAPFVLTVLLVSLEAWLAERWNDLPRPSTPVTLGLVAVGSVLLFWFLRETRHWGDAGYTIRILEGTVDVDPLGIYFWKEPLDRLLTLGFHGICSRLFGWGAAQSVALLSSLAGGAFVAALVFVSRRLGRTAGARVFIFAFTLSMGAVQIFFGHVENYTLVTLCVLLFVWVGLRYLNDESGWGTVGLVAAIAVSVHPLAAFLLIPLLALPFLRSVTLSPWLFLKSAIPGAVYLGLFYLVCRLLGAGPIVVGVNRFADNESVWHTIPEAFARQHLWEVAQNLMMIVPLGLFVLLPFVVANRALRPWSFDRVSLFLLLTSASFFVYVLFFHGTLPRVVDWDLYAAAALPWTLWVGYEVQALFDKRKNRALAVYAVLLSLAYTLPWVWSNFRPEG